MMKQIMVTLLVYSSLPAIAGKYDSIQMDGFSFFAIYEKCKNSYVAESKPTPTIKDVMEFSACYAYLSAAIDRHSVFGKPPYCAPKNLTLGNVTERVIILGDSISRESGMSERKVMASAKGLAVIGIDSALMASYPCNPQKTP